jgi:hypothetical protein
MKSRAQVDFITYQASLLLLALLIWVTAGGDEEAHHFATSIHVFQAVFAAFYWLGGNKFPPSPPPRSPNA